MVMAGRLLRLADDSEAGSELSLWLGVCTGFCCGWSCDFSRFEGVMPKASAIGVDAMWNGELMWIVIMRRSKERMDRERRDLVERFR